MAISHTHVNFAQHGDEVVFSHFGSAGDMWTGTGDREVSKRVTFDNQFQSNPIVQLSVTLMDADSDKFMRYSINASNINTKGFDIVFKTWLDSRFARVWVSWIAIGERKDPDMWEL